MSVRTLILGGGFGGIAAGVELRRLQPEHEVVLVDRKPGFAMGLRKLWSWSATQPSPRAAASVACSHATGSSSSKQRSPRSTPRDDPQRRAQARSRRTVS